MIRIHCQEHRDADGIHLTTRESWRFREPNTATLTGTEAELWTALRELAEQPRTRQRRLVQALSEPTRASLIRAAALLEKGGFLTLESGPGAIERPQPGVPRLGKLHLEITHRCNFACRACYLGSCLKRPGDRTANEGTTEDWLAVIRQAADLGLSLATITGGEPFLRPDTPRLVRELSDHGVICEINTNASPITARVAAELDDCLISTVAVSLYGHDAGSARAYTGNPSAFRASLAGIRHLAERGIPLKVKYFATHDNYDGFARAREALEPLGIQPRLIGHAIHGDVFEGTLPDPEIAEGALPRPPVEQETPLPCYPALHGLGIGPDGTVRACPKLAVYFGNVFEEGLGSLWKRCRNLDDFRTFWVGYCKDEGYVKGATHGSLCPAARLLSRQGGLTDFRRRWAAWQEDREHHPPPPGQRERRPHA